MRRLMAVLLASLLLCGPAAASDEKDCDYWRLGKDEADQASRFAACNRIIANEHLDARVRALAYAERASWTESNHGAKANAIADYDKALELAPGNNQWLRNRAYLLYFNKEYDRAIRDFNDLLAAKVEAHPTFFRGLAWLEKKDEAKGFADLAKGIELDPNDYWYPYQRAVELTQRGRAEEALPDLDKAIAIKGTEVNPYLLRAEIRDKRGETDKALADLNRVVEIEPKRVSAYINRANIYEKMGELDRAIADYDTLISLNPGDNYYVERKAGMAAKLAARGGEPAPAEPAAPSPAAAPQAAAPPAPAPTAPAAPPKPPPAPNKEAAQAPAGEHECRRFDAIANRTISIPCPD